MNRFLTTIFFFIILTSSLHAQSPLSYYLPDSITYDNKIPTPEEIIGHEVGEWHVTHDKLVYYMKALAAAAKALQR